MQFSSHYTCISLLLSENDFLKMSNSQYIKMHQKSHRFLFQYFKNIIQDIAKTTYISISKIYLINYTVTFQKRYFENYRKYLILRSLRIYFYSDIPQQWNATRMQEKSRLFAINRAYISSRRD